ncbi:MAG TPA: hypothetical protein VK187_01410 [Geobacteraceae bacterium]|nr:hypothetical protein [Geobacteraceae bacterium]
MPSFYCIKFGLVCAGLILVGITALFTLIYALSSVGVKHDKEKLGDQNA